MNTQPYVFCPYCAARLVERPVFGQVRPACPQDHFVFFRDPKVGVIARVIHRDRVLLVRRGVEPARGRWALPGGFMDAGEMPEEALCREFMEEVNLPIEVLGLLDIYPMADGEGGSRGIVLAYSAKPRRQGPGSLQVGDDVSAAGWFAPDEVPDDLAFETTTRLLDMWKTDF